MVNVEFHGANLYTESTTDEFGNVFKMPHEFLKGSSKTLLFRYDAKTHHFRKLDERTHKEDFLFRKNIH